MGRKWNELTIREKAPYIRTAVKYGYTDINDIIDRYNKFSEGGDMRPDEEEPIYYGGMSPEITINYNPGFIGPGSKLRKALRTAASNAVIADNPAVMTASGYHVDNNGYLRHNPDNKGARQLSKALAGIGGAGAAMYLGAPALAYAGEMVSPYLSVINPSAYIGADYTAKNLAGRALIGAGTELGLTTVFPSLSTGNVGMDMLNGVAGEFGGELLAKGVIWGYDKLGNLYKLAKNSALQNKLNFQRAKTRYINGPIRRAKRAREFYENAARNNFPYEDDYVKYNKEPLPESATLLASFSKNVRAKMRYDTNKLSRQYDDTIEREFQVHKEINDIYQKYHNYIKLEGNPSHSRLLKKKSQIITTPYLEKPLMVEFPYINMPREEVTFMLLSEADKNIWLSIDKFDDYNFTYPVRNQKLMEVQTQYLNSLRGQLPKRSALAGSSLLVEKGIIPKVASDVEVLALPGDAAEVARTFGVDKLPNMSDAFGVKKYTLKKAPKNRYNEGDVDIDILDVDEMGMARGKLAHEIYAAIFPEQYGKFISSGTGEAIRTGNISIDTDIMTKSLPISGEELLKVYNTGDNAIKVQIANYLSSSKDKHVKMVKSMIANPEYTGLVRETIKRKARGYIPEYKTVSESYPNIRYDNVESNKALLNKIDFPEEYADNPEIMKTIAEKLNFDNLHGRHQRIENKQYLNTNVAKRTGSGSGGNASFGSGGGSQFGPVAGLFQRQFSPSQINTPLDFYNMNQKMSIRANKPFTDKEKNAIKEILGIDEAPENIAKLDNYLVNIKDLTERSLITSKVARELKIPGFINETMRWNQGHPYFGIWDDHFTAGNSVFGNTFEFEKGTRLLDIQYGNPRHEGYITNMEGVKPEYWTLLESNIPGIRETISHYNELMKEKFTLLDLMGDLDSRLSKANNYGYYYEPSQRVGNIFHNFYNSKYYKYKRKWHNITQK